MKRVIVISAVWCPSCLLLKKSLKKLQNDYDISIETLDYDFDEDEVRKYSVGDILPVIVVKDENKEKGRLIGEKTYEEILEFLKEQEVL